MAANENILILDREQIEQKVNRMAYQIYEQNFDEKHIVVCGIVERGFLLARKIYDKLKEITDFELELCAVHVDKNNLKAKNITIDPNPGDLSQKSVILCDDVLYTGKTLAYAAIPFLEGGAKKLQCLVLIQRHHLNFPVQPTYIGMNLATTIQEHVTVNLLDDARVVLG
jgi:pyrimidine operon attenuation protein/uracil phosphoribosyltransferase